MKTAYVCLLFILVIHNNYAQSFQIGHLQYTFMDSSRANRQIPCEIYYPSDVAGNNTPVASGKFPVLVFGHGFVMTWSSYDIYWQNLVPQGYIMIFPTTESSLSPSHMNFGKDLAFLCSAMKSSGNEVSSPFYRAVETTSAVMGHSMGGGCAFLAMQYDTSITAMATVAAAVTNPSSIQAAASILKPALVFAGANDCVAPPPAHQIPMYDSLWSTSKTYISLTGGNHCQFASYNFYCSFGQSTCTPQATIDVLTQQNLVFSYLLPWLNFYLKGDCDAGKKFQNLISISNGISYKQNRSLLCDPNSVDESLDDTICDMFPNPCDKLLTIGCTEEKNNLYYRIRTLLGQHLKSGVLQEMHSEIDVSDLPEGPCLISINKVSKLILIKR